MPVLALGGERKVAKEMQALAENLRGGIIEQARHWRPGELSRQLLRFFGR